MAKLELDKEEEEKLNCIKSALTTLFGSSGDLTFIIKQGSGIGENLYVKSSHVDEEFDLTNYSAW